MSGHALRSATRSIGRSEHAGEALPPRPRSRLKDGRAPGCRSLIDDGHGWACSVAAFDIVHAEDGLELHGERRNADGARPLLGKPTPLRWTRLGAWHDRGACSPSVSEEPAARAMLVTAPAGMGKSRLASTSSRAGSESAARTRRSGSAGSTRSQAGSAFGAAWAGAFQRAFALRGRGGDRSAQEPGTGRRVAERVPVRARRRRVAEFLGEIVGTPFTR